MDLHLHDKVELKKAHPCGSTQWEILRVGMTSSSNVWAAGMS